MKLLELLWFVSIVSGVFTVGSLFVDKGGVDNLLLWERVVLLLFIPIIQLLSMSGCIFWCFGCLDESQESNDAHSIMYSE